MGTRRKPWGMHDFRAASKKLGSGGFGDVFVGIVLSDIERGVNTHHPYLAMKFVDLRSRPRADIVEYAHAERDCLLDLQVSPFFPK